MLLRLSLVTLAFLLGGCEDARKWAYQAGLDAEKSRAGLVDRELTTADGIAWHLLESEAADDRPVVLLVHGFGADSSNWVRFANELEGHYRFVIPDLPGHGATTRDTALDYAVEEQARRLLTLADAMGIREFHVAGSSMGGAIGLALSLDAPERVLSLGLVNAAGVTLMTEEFAALVNGGENPLIPQKPEDMHETMAWAMADPPWIPDFFVEEMGRLKASNYTVARKVHGDINGRMEMRDRLPDVQVPTLVLWGDLDRLLALENAAVFDREIPNSRLVMLRGIGHLPMAEAPDRSAEVFGDFWQEAEAYIARVRVVDDAPALPVADQ